MAHNENVIHTEKDLTLTTKTLQGVPKKTYFQNHPRPQA